jgi:hypothetical protein
MVYAVNTELELLMTSPIISTLMATSGWTRNSEMPFVPNKRNYETVVTDLEDKSKSLLILLVKQFPPVYLFNNNLTVYF